MKIKIKKTIFFLLLLLSCSLAKAQNGILNYKLTTDERNNDNLTRIENYICYFTNNKSIEFFQPANIQESTVQTGENSVTKTILFKDNSNKKLFVYKDFENKKLLLADNIIYKKYLIEDTLSNFKWEITNEHQKILKYSCTKATTNFRGRAYIAWFTDDIPIQNGPWKFCGLPGLIVKINDTENRYTFELEGIDLKTQFDTSIISVPNAYADNLPITHSAFLQLYNKKVLNINASNRASVKTTSMGNGTHTTWSNDSIPIKIEKF